MIFALVLLAILAVPAGFWLLQRRVERACRMSASWLERWHRETQR